jgi:hypothetical protein
MRQVPLHRLEEIGRAAARAVAGGTVRDLKVRSGADASYDPAYYLTFVADRETIRRPEISVRIAHRVRDALLEQDDETYPYISLVSQEEWDRA